MYLLPIDVDPEPFRFVPYLILPLVAIAVIALAVVLLRRRSGDKRS